MSSQPCGSQSSFVEYLEAFIWLQLALQWSKCTYWTSTSLQLTLRCSTILHMQAFNRLQGTVKTCSTIRYRRSTGFAVVKTVLSNFYRPPSTGFLKLYRDSSFSAVHYRCLTNFVGDKTRLMIAYKASTTFKVVKMGLANIYSNGLFGSQKCLSMVKICIMIRYRHSTGFWVVKNWPAEPQYFNRQRSSWNWTAEPLQPINRYCSSQNKHDSPVQAFN